LASKNSNPKEFKEAYVFAPSAERIPTLAGTIKITPMGGEFSYAESWYNNPSAYALDPIVSSQGQQSMSVGLLGRTSTIQNALTALPDFGIETELGMKIIGDVLAVIKNWKSHFVDAGVLPLGLQILENIIERNMDLARRDLASVTSAS
jgi:hypothetical protein